MCGVIGLFGEKALKSVEKFEDSIKLISHRGPDHSGYAVINDNLLLGHTRLSILDLNARSHQPYQDEDGNVLVFNGEIFNYEELKEKELSDYEFQTTSDTEVLFYLLKKFGIKKCLDRLNGMFAFLYWDNGQKQLHAARDRIGKKPLFFTQVDNRIYFSSEAKAFKGFDVDFKINEAAIINFLFDRRAGIGEESFFANIKEIENGYYYTFEYDEQITFERFQYYTLGDIKTDYSITYEEAVEGFKELFRKSINMRLCSDVPIGLLLSGGLDSSAVVSMLAKENPSRKFNVVSAIYPNQQFDESAFAQEVVNKYDNLEKNFIEMSSDEFFEHLDQTIYFQEMPIADGSMVAHNILMKKISELGIKVILSGDGGDEIHAGYDAHHKAFSAYLLQRLDFNKMNFSSLKDGLYHILPSSFKQKVKNLLARRSNFLINTKKLNLRYNIYNDALNDGDLINFYLKMSLASWATPGFLWYEDRNAMQYGIENRSPFLDYKLIEWMLKVPGDYKINTVSRKNILRDAMKDIVPEKILSRNDKQGFHSPIDQYEKFIDYKSIKNDAKFARDFSYLNIPKILDSGFLYRWRLFSIYRWYKIYIVN